MKRHDLLQQVGCAIATKRKLVGLKQDELAEKLDLTNVHISRYECGRSAPGIVLLYQMAEILECNIFDFLPNSEKNTMFEMPKSLASKLQNASMKERIMIYKFLEAYFDYM